MAKSKNNPAAPEEFGGPHAAELIKAIREFARDHNGSTYLRFTEIADAPSQDDMDGAKLQKIIAITDAVIAPKSAKSTFTLEELETLHGLPAALGRKWTWAAVVKQEFSQGWKGPIESLMPPPSHKVFQDKMDGFWASHNRMIGSWMELFDDTARLPKEMQAVQDMLDIMEKYHASEKDLDLLLSPMMGRGPAIEEFQKTLTDAHAYFDRQYQRNKDYNSELLEAESAIALNTFNHDVQPLIGPAVKAWNAPGRARAR